MLLFGILTYLVIFAIIMYSFIKIAPFGYEDEDGFHLIKVDDLKVNNTDINRNLADLNNKAA